MVMLTDTIRRYRLALGTLERRESELREAVRDAISGGSSASSIARELGWSRQRLWAWMQVSERLPDVSERLEEPAPETERRSAAVWEPVAGYRAVTPDGVAYMFRSPLREASVRWALKTGERLPKGYSELGMADAVRLAERNGWTVLRDRVKKG